ASAMFRRARVEVVPYGIDVDARQRVAAADARTALGLPSDAVVLFAASVNNGETRKGDAHLADALKLLRAGHSSPRSAPPLIVLTAGRDARSGEFEGFPCRTIGAVPADDARLEMAFRAADMFVLPTLEDNLP